MAWIEKDHNDHRVSTPPCYVQDRQPLDTAQSHIQPGLECLQGWDIHNLLGNLFNSPKQFQRSINNRLKLGLGTFPNFPPFPSPRSQIQLKLPTVSLCTLEPQSQLETSFPPYARCGSLQGIFPTIDLKICI